MFEQLFFTRPMQMVQTEEPAQAVRPKADAVESEKEVRVYLEMPNIDRESLKVAVKDGILTVEARRNQNGKNGNYLFKETSQQNYFRNFELGENLDPEKISARYHNGILTLICQKKEKALPRTIQVN